MPPTFIPTTAVDNAGGAFGPLIPEKSPPAESPTGFADFALTGSPAINSKGSAIVRLPPSKRAEREETTSMPLKIQS